MEAIRRNLIPREAALNLISNLPQRAPRVGNFKFQNGGLAQQVNPSTQNVDNRPVIINVNDRRDVGKYLNTFEGRSVFLNVISEESNKVNTILSRDK
jgi:hypothetical protein